ncbi:MAG: hypothetical protein Q9164_002702 [Protoblastenia rupestris]
MILEGGCSIARLPQLSAQCFGNRRTLLTSNLDRVRALYNLLASANDAQSGLNSRTSTSIPYRTYATRPVSRPKAHTGRTTSSTRKAPTTSATKAAKKPAIKKTTAKSVPKAKSKAKPTTKAKPKAGKKAKAKPKPRKKAQAKPKPKRKRVVLTEKGKARKAAKDKIRTLKQLTVTALSPPGNTPNTAWKVYSTEFLHLKKDTTASKASFTTMMPEAAANFKAFEPEQLEHYNHLANQNVAKDEKAYRQFIESHTPLEIYNANIARASLQRLGLKEGAKQKSSKWKPLRDERQVKRPATSYNLFYVDRMKSGDMKGIKVEIASGMIAREWKALPAEEKKPYDAAAAADMERYVQERKTVLGKDVKHRKAKTD